MFKELFTTYQVTEPPPIIPSSYQIPNEDYKDKITFDQYIPYSIASDNINLDMFESPLAAKTQEPFQIDSQEQYNPTQQFNSVQDSIQNAIKIARSFVGSKYVYGGSNPQTGFDCSGLIQYAFKQSGIDLPRTASALGKTGQEVPSLDSARIGDILYTKGTGPSGNHVKIISDIKDGDIYTIEAKGQKYGIIESKLTNTNNIRSIRRITKNPTTNQIIRQSTSANIGNKKDYVKAMYPYLYNALEKQGINGRLWTPTLIAHTSIESGWGNNFSRKTNNFGGIKGKGSGTVKTKEWSPTRGYYTINDEFKSFGSIQEFADYYVNRLKNKFKAFNGSPSQYLSNIRSHGYFTASLSGYQKQMNDRIKIVNNVLNS